ncbi:MAG: Hsp70 family protein [Cyanobacteria bacterium P01_F01_bin.150]
MTAVAIDFGTSNTVVSIWEVDTQAPATLRFPSLSRLFRDGSNQDVAVVPSMVYVRGVNQIVAGEPVRSQRLGLSQPKRFFRGFKRDLAADVRPPERTLDGQIYDAEAIAHRFLAEIWAAIRKRNIEPSVAILSVPVGAFDRYLNWFKTAAIKLRCPSVKFVDESTAAALGYAVERPGSTVLVADFGGGTLDLSLVRTATLAHDQTVLKAEVLAKADAYVGGEDIDRWIVERYLDEMSMTREGIGEVGWQNLLAIAERVKIRLSQTSDDQAEVQESWLDEETFMAYDLKLRRSQFEQLLEDKQLLEQFRQAIDEVLALGLRKGLPKSEIDQVLLVGGSCQIQAIQQIFKVYFGAKRVQVHKPFEAVAHGALLLTQVARLEDYLRHGYSIRLWDPYTRSHTFFPLFEPGTPYPCRRENPLTLQVAIEGQTDIRLDIGEVAQVTESEVVYDEQGRMTSKPINQQDTYRSLSQHADQVCLAHLDPPGQLGVDRISVDFEVTEHRMLVATVQDLLTDKVLVERGAIAKLD